MSWTFQHKLYYNGDTDGKSCNTEESQSDNENLVKKVVQGNSIKNIMNAGRILLRFLKQNNLKWSNLKYKKNR